MSHAIAQKKRLTSERAGFRSIFDTQYYTQNGQRTYNMQVYEKKKDNE